MRPENSDNIKDSVKSDIIKKIKLLKDTQEGLVLFSEMLEKDHSPEDGYGDKKDNVKNSLVIKSMIYKYIDELRVEYMKIEEGKLINTINQINNQR